MKAEDKARLESGEYDRKAWAELWDRLPQKMRLATAEFVLHKLHAVESGGTFSFRYNYESSAEREAREEPACEADQPGDVITFKGRFVFGYS